MPKKESGAQGRKRRAQFEAFLNESRKFMKKNFKSSGYAKRQSADIRRQDKSAGTDNHRIVKHRGAQNFCLPRSAGYPCYATGGARRIFMKGGPRYAKEIYRKKDDLCGRCKRYGFYRVSQEA